jgi:DNA-directed RNA polymerase subunit RPC12/RpoP
MPLSKDEMIVFLCPNGHRLNGPRSLEGKPGKCPHCGVKFLVPTHDDPSDDDDGGSRILVNERPAAGELAVQGVPGSDVGRDSDAHGFDFNFADTESMGPSATAAVPRIETGSRGDSGVRAGSGPRLGGSHPMAELFARFWDERSRGAFVEVHLDDGAIIIPERYSRELSRSSHGVFAVKDPDGTHTLSLVAWDSVRRINVRRVSKLPKKIFD